MVDALAVRRLVAGGLEPLECDDVCLGAAFLEAAFEDGGDDPAFIAQALGAIARSGNAGELERRTGMSCEGASARPCRLTATRTSRRS